MPSSKTLFFWACVVGFLVACRPGTHQRGDGGWPEEDGDTADQDGDDSVDPDVIPPDPECAEGARWVYLVDDARQFMRFEPDSLTLVSLGTLSCPSGLGSPFSMSVDRNGMAWVLYNGGRIYHVPIDDPSQCTVTEFASGQEGFGLFGMGFVANAEASTEETLFIAGGPAGSVATGQSTLGTIDTRTLTVHPIGELPGWPELTGTGRGELWGFLPDTSPPSVRQLRKEDGETLQTFELSMLGEEDPGAWAFAFWGGRFYIFLQRSSDTSTNVYRLDPRDGSVEEVLHDTGYRIVGAGVSTCAPYDLI